MPILTDSEIVTLITSENSILQDYEKPDNWFSKTSLVQPSSLDLHIGTIFIPPKEELSVAMPVDERTEYTLGPGQAVMVNTLESLNLHNNISAFGFPPTSISDRAILMTNPGHIDPGYQGKLNFTLINMGREAYYIQKGQIIITLLLDKLEMSSKKSYSERAAHGTPSTPNNNALSRLGRDFLDLEQRMKRTADNSIKADNATHARRELWLPIVVALVTAVASFLAAHLQSKDELRKLENKFFQLEEKFNIEKRIEAIETKIDTLKSSRTR